MAFEPIFESINYTCAKKTLTEQIKIESRADINGEDVSSILNVHAWSTITYLKPEENKIEYGGKIIFYISYLNSQGMPTKCECGSEFKGVIKDESINLSSKVSAVAIVDKAFTEQSSNKLNAHAFVTVKVEVSSCEQVSALSGGENLVVNENELSYHRVCGEKTANYPIEEEFKLNYPVMEVLSHRVEPIVSNVQCGVGAIIVDGEIILSAIMLQKDQRNGIIKETKTFPYRMEVECEEVMPNALATAKVKARSFKTDVSVDADAGESTVSLSANLEFETEAFIEDVVKIATDAFSTEQEIELVKRDLECYKSCEVKKYSAIVKGVAPTDELPIGASILAVGGERVQVTKVEKEDNKTVVNGVISAVSYFRDANGGIFTSSLETPFECSLDCVLEENSLFELDAKAFNGRARIISLTETELESELSFTIYSQEKCKLNVIGEVKAMGEKVKNDCALSVYIPLQGEDLWSLAKRLNVCPEELAQTNADLQFPLSGDERIVIYRQK